MTPELTNRHVASSEKDGEGEIREINKKLKEHHERIALFHEARDHFKKSEDLLACANYGHAAPVTENYFLFMKRKVCSRCGKKL